MVDENTAMPTTYTGTLSADGFEVWLTWETILGEFGIPGFEKVIKTGRFTHFFGDDRQADIIFTTYRDDDGLLLGFHSEYRDEEGFLNPFYMSVNPDHRRKGVASILAAHTEERFIAEEGPTYGFSHSEFAAMSRKERTELVMPNRHKALTTTDDGAGFLNKHIKSMLETDGAQGEAP